MKKEEKFVQICPSCKKPFRPAKTVSNLFGIIPLSWKCKECGFTGGPIKVKEKDFKKLFSK